MQHDVAARGSYKVWVNLAQQHHARAERAGKCAKVGEKTLYGISLVRMVGCRTYIEESDDCSYNACSNEQPNISDYILNAMAIMPTAIVASNMVPLMRPIRWFLV